MVWERPAGPPKVWSVCEAIRKGEKEEPVKLKIQEIPEDRYDDVIKHMTTHFIISEVLCSTLNVKADKLAVSEMSDLWMDTLKQGISVAAFVDEPGNDKPEIAGLNVLHVTEKEDEGKSDILEYKSHPTKTIISVLHRLTKEYNVWDKHNVDQYLTAFGLSVKPSFRGQRLGEKILDVRRQIGREYNIPLTSTLFTSDISQKVASRAGYEVFIEKDYDEIKTEDGKLAFPGIKVKSVKIMGRRLT